MAMHVYADVNLVRRKFSHMHAFTAEYCMNVLILLHAPHTNVACIWTPVLLCETMYTYMHTYIHIMSCLV